MSGPALLSAGCHLQTGKLDLDWAELDQIAQADRQAQHTASRV